MTNNERITLSAIKAVTGDLRVSNDRSGICLKVVREIVQDALDMSYDDFYSRFLIQKADGTDPLEPYARDVQLSLRLLGKGVKEPMAGDLGFSWKPLPWGHVWVYITPNYIVENINTNRKSVIRRGFISVTDVRTINMPIEVFRL